MGEWKFDWMALVLGVIYFAYAVSFIYLLYSLLGGE